ncbi:alpha-2-macroglobulin-like protein 1 [Pelobates fuscus]|uniref:alpha-2-macroglobulin-like protein 1 n=1 Tax=Pelobates fuscus TaxID=191477 RepID=UPI002FE4D635
MGLLLLLLLLICSSLWSSLGDSSKMYYVLLVPAEVHYPSTEKAFVHVIGARENLTLTVTLQSEGEDIMLHQQDMTGPMLHHCIHFQVPAPADGEEEVVSIHISLLGKSTDVSESKKIQIRHMGTATMIETDKPMYNCGEQVNFRILIFNINFLAANGMVSLVQLKDPKENLISQWINLSPQQGIIDLSFSLGSECIEGMYTIKTPDEQQVFQVQEHVLPRSEVLMMLPSAVTVLDQTLDFKICARYTFGEPVSGTITSKLCRKVVPYYWNVSSRPTDICTTHTGRTDETGCLDMEVTTASYQLRSYDYQMKFVAEATLEEDGTGMQINATGSSRITAVIAKVTIEDVEISDSHYKPGLRYKGKMKLEGADGTPMKSQTLYLTEEYNREKKERTYITDENGQVTFTLDTKPWKSQSVYLTASYMKKKTEIIYGELNPVYIDAHITLQPFSTLTNSFLKIQPADLPLTCHQEHQIEIDYLIRGSELMGNVKTLEVVYVVVAKGNIVLNGQMSINVNRNSVVTGTLQLPLMVTADIAPLMYMLVYTMLNNGQMSADTERFQVEKCFNNKVTLQFSDDEVTPGSTVSMHLTAAPGSLCSIKAVDKGVYLLNPKAEISTDTLYNLLDLRSRYGYPYRVQEQDFTCWKGPSRYNKRSLETFHRKKRFVSFSPEPSAPDAFSLIKRLGIKILSNGIIRNPAQCLHSPFKASQFGYDSFAHTILEEEPSRMVERPRDTAYGKDMFTDIKQTIRQNLQKTWIWELVPVGSSGEAVLNTQIPDVITEWKTKMFCMGDSGLGLSPPVSIKTFQSIFLEPILPTSIVRGETCVLRALIFNYLDDTTMIKSTALASPQMEIIPCENCSYIQCLAPHETKIFTWNVRPLNIGLLPITVNIEAISTSELCDGKTPVVPENGASDTLIKSVIVKPEGMVVETSQNTMLCASGNLSKEVISISLPPEVVPDSARAEIFVMGDLLAVALQGTEDLLKLPNGCGGQNMMHYAINVYVLQYLEKTGQLSESIRAQAEDFMRHGYQQELKFKRIDGSFSEFGDKDKEGNTWLNALVMKTMYASSRYISVEQKHINDIAKWLKENQLPSGCFTSKGKLFKESLSRRAVRTVNHPQSSEEGNNDDVAFTAYVAICLFECDWPREDEMLKNSMRFLQASLPQVDQLHTKALLSYLFTMSGDTELREGLLEELYEEAVIRDGQVYWSFKTDSSSSKPNSLEVEVASFVALAHLSMKAPTKKDIFNASKIISWLSNKQNSHGGFAGTQDTLVAFQALCRYAELTYTGHLDLEVTVTGDDFQYKFSVNDTTRLLLQKGSLQQIPGNYTIQLKGEGCAYVRTMLKYNMNSAEKSIMFDLHVNTTTADCKDRTKLCFHINICTRYIGQRTETGMALIEVDLLSGCSADIETIAKLEMQSLVMKTEVKRDKVIIYINGLSHQTECFSFTIIQDIPVENVRPQLVKVFSYYMPDEEAYAMYNLPN